MKTILYIKGNPIKIVTYCCNGIFGRKDITLSYSSVKVNEDGLVFSFLHGNKPHLLALLFLKEEFELRRIDPVHTTIYFKDFSMMSGTPERIANQLRKTKAA